MRKTEGIDSVITDIFQNLSQGEFVQTSHSNSSRIWILCEEQKTWCQPNLYLLFFFYMVTSQYIMPSSQKKHIEIQSTLITTDTLGTSFSVRDSESQ